jgi:hypothetical protein
VDHHNFGNQFCTISAPLFHLFRNRSLIIKHLQQELHQALLAHSQPQSLADFRRLS